MSTAYWSERQGGRTKRMMLKAIERARAGEAPIIVINSLGERGYLRDLWAYLGGEPGAVTFMTSKQNYNGIQTPALFVDHHVFEVGYDNASLDYLLNRYSKEAGAE